MGAELVGVNVVGAELVGVNVVGATLDGTREFGCRVDGEADDGLEVVAWSVGIPVDATYVHLPRRHVEQDASQCSALVQLLPHGATHQPDSEQMSHLTSKSHPDGPLHGLPHRVGGTD